MNAILEWLLGLERIRLASDAPLSVRLSDPPSAWVLVAGLVLVAGIVVLAYRAESAGARTRVLLAACRMSVILLIMGVAARPVLVLARNRVEPSFVAVLVDRSASMAVSEARGPPAPAATVRKMRWDEARNTLLGERGVLAQLAARHQVGVWLFDERARPVATIRTKSDLAAATAALERSQPRGPGTDLAAGLMRVLDDSRGARLAGVIVVSDGRQTGGRPIDPTLEDARARGARVYALAAGPDRPLRDVAVQSVWSDPVALAGVPTLVRARVTQDGYDGPVDARAELHDAETDALLAAEDVRLEAAAAEIAVPFAPQREGIQRLRLDVRPRADEDDPENNRGHFSIEVIDEKIRVLYVEQEPRFEYRFLRNVLLREPGFDSSILLLSASEGFAPEGSAPIRRFPASPGEINAFDVIILGDVDPRGDWIAPAQVGLLTDFVSVRGGGLILLAGERSMPFKLAQTPLEKLLPVRLDPRFFGRYEGTLDEPFAPALTPAGRRHPLFLARLSDPADSSRASDQTAASDPSGDPPPGAPLATGVSSETADVRTLTLAGRNAVAPGGWYWYARTAGARPGSEVLAEHPTARGPDGALPLIVAGRYGAGRTLFHGSDDTYRWRRDLGEDYYEAYWTRAIRMLAGTARAGRRAGWRLEADRAVVAPGEPVGLRLRSPDRSMWNGRDPIEASIQEADGRVVDTVTLTRSAGDDSNFEGVFWPGREGRFRATAADLDTRPAWDRGRGRESAVHGFGPVARTAAVEITVRADRRERTNASTDHDTLRMIAARTDGRCVPLDQAVDLLTALPDQSVVIPDDVTEPLWDSRLVLLLFAAPLIVEWVVRKANGLA